MHTKKRLYADIKGGGMKIISITLAAVMAVSGLVLAGAENQVSFGWQVIINVGGVCMTMAGGFWMSKISRRE